MTDYLQKKAGTDHYDLMATRIRNAVEKHRAKTNYRELFEKSTVGITIVDPETRELLAVNERFAAILKRPIDEIVGRHPAELSRIGTSRVGSGPPKSNAGPPRRAPIPSNGSTRRAAGSPSGPR